MSIVKVTKKLFKLLNTHQKIRVFELAILMFIGAGLETITVILFGIFANCLIDTETIQTNKLLFFFSTVTGIHSPKTVIMAFAIGLAVLYIIKDLYNIWEYSVQYGFTTANTFIMQNQVLKNVMGRPYESFLYADSGEMIRFVTSDVSSVFGMISLLLSFYTEFVVSVFLIVLVLVETPLMSMGIAFILLFSLLLVMKAIKPRVEYIGRKQRKLRAVTTKSFIEIIEGIKEVKVLRKEDYFRQKYYDASMGLVKLGKRLSVLQLLPKNIIESTCMAGVFIMTSALIYVGNDLNAILSSIAMTAMAAMRLLPSVNRISSVMTQISLDEEIIDNVSRTIGESEEYNSQIKKIINEKKEGHVDNGLSFSKKIELKSLSYAYPDSNKLIINDANLIISKGETIGIIGPSGGGKTTLLNLLLGLLPPTSGDITLDGSSIFSKRGEWLSIIGYIPQSIFIIDDGIRENIAFGVDRNNIDDKKIREVVKAAALEEYIDGLPDGLETKVGERGLRISGGQRQRIGIARALYFSPEVLFFDEATSALDIQTEAEIMKSIEALKGKITMIIVAHRYSTVEGCDRIWKVSDGKVNEVDKSIIMGTYTYE